MGAYGPDWAVRAPLLAPVLGLPMPDSNLTRSLDPQARAELLLAAEELAGRLESALDAATQTWQSEEPAGEDQPAVPPASLATLRRRYHELGASNPFAAEEYEELKARLESLEAQRSDLESAIAGARELIAELDSR